MQDLALRLSRKYVGTYAGEDDWTSLGGFDVTHREAHLLDESDPCEPTEITLRVRVESDAPEEEIVQALKDSNSRGGCHHDWDCCGCTSFYVTDVSRNPDGSFTLKQSSSRNY